MDEASRHAPDHCYAPGDLENPVRAKLKANSGFKFNHDEFIKSRRNMAADKFSTDRTIAEYEDDIRKIPSHKNKKA